jgi:hypothetical protein
MSAVDSRFAHPVSGRSGPLAERPPVRQAESGARFQRTLDRACRTAVECRGPGTAGRIGKDSGGGHAELSALRGGLDGPAARDPEDADDGPASSRPDEPPGPSAPQAAPAVQPCGLGGATDGGQGLPVPERPSSMPGDQTPLVRPGATPDPGTAAGRSQEASRADLMRALAVAALRADTRTELRLPRLGRVVLHVRASEGPLRLVVEIDASNAAAARELGRELESAVAHGVGRATVSVVVGARPTTVGQPGESAVRRERLGA